MATVGEMLVELEALVTGALTATQLAELKARVIAAADQARVPAAQIAARACCAVTDARCWLGAQVEADVTLLCGELPSDKAGAATSNAPPPPPRGAPDSSVLLLRRRASVGAPLELRIAVIGNVDTGKSTLVGVLTRGCSVLDDGRGSARSKVAKHAHGAVERGVCSRCRSGHCAAAGGGDEQCQDC